MEELPSPIAPGTWIFGVYEQYLTMVADIQTCVNDNDIPRALDEARYAYNYLCDEDNSFLWDRGLKRPSQFLRHMERILTALFCNLSNAELNDRLNEAYDFGARVKRIRYKQGLP